MNRARRDRAICIEVCHRRLRWLQQQGFKDLWARADALMKDAPKLNEDEILKLRSASIARGSRAG